MRTQLKSDLASYGATYPGELNDIERFFLEDSGVDLASKAWAAAAGLNTRWRRLRRSQQSVDRQLQAPVVPNPALSVVLALVFVAMLFSAFVVLLGFLSLVFWGESPDSFVVKAIVVLMFSTLAFRFLSKPVIAMKARLPVRCRVCSYVVPRA